MHRIPRILSDRHGVSIYAIFFDTVVVRRNGLVCHVDDCGLSRFFEVKVFDGGGRRILCRVVGLHATAGKSDVSVTKKSLSSKPHRSDVFPW